MKSTVARSSDGEATPPFNEIDERSTLLANTAATLGLDQSTVAEVIAASGDEIYSIVVALES